MITAEAKILIFLRKRGLVTVVVCLWVKSQNFAKNITEFNESLELTASLKRIASPQQCSPLLQCQHYAIRNVKKKLCLSLLHWGK